jgi:hypothetical protein
MFLKLFPRLILIVLSKVLQLNLKRKIFKNQIIQFIVEVAVLEYSFLNHSQGILGVNNIQIRKYIF